METKQSKSYLNFGNKVYSFGWLLFAVGLILLFVGLFDVENLLGAGAVLVPSGFFLVILGKIIEAQAANMAVNERNGERIEKELVLMRKLLTAAIAGNVKVAEKESEDTEEEEE